MRRALLLSVLVSSLALLILNPVEAQTPASSPTQSSGGGNRIDVNALEFQPVATGAVIFQGKGENRKPIATVMNGTLYPADPKMTEDEKSRLFTAYKAWGKAGNSNPDSKNPGIDTETQPPDKAGTSNLYKGTDANGDYQIEFTRATAHVISLNNPIAGVRMPRSDVTIAFDDVGKGKTVAGKILTGAVLAGAYSTRGDTGVSLQTYTFTDNVLRDSWNTQDLHGSSNRTTTCPDPGFQAAARRMVEAADSDAAKAAGFALMQRKQLQKVISCVPQY
jgi:hypothetical protein